MLCSRGMVQTRTTLVGELRTVEAGIGLTKYMGIKLSTEELEVPKREKSRRMFLKRSSAKLFLSLLVCCCYCFLSKNLNL